MAFGEWPETIFSSAASWTVLLAASPSWELCTTVSPCIWTRLPEQHKSFPFAAWNPQHYPLSQLYLRNVFIALNTCISKGTAVKCAVSSLVLFQLFFFVLFISDANVLDSLVSAASRQSYTFLFVKVYFVIINQLFVSILV